MSVITTHFGPLIGNAINDNVLKRTVKIQGERGASIVSVIQLLKSLGIVEEDVDAVCSTMPGSLAYDVVFQNTDKLTDFLATHTSNQVKFKNLSYKFESYGKQVIQLRVHWLPIFVNNMVLREFFGQFGTVREIVYESLQVEGFKAASGVRLVTLELSHEAKAEIPHMVVFECGTRALVTMRGRPPLCLRCMHLGHMRGDCPSSVTKRAVSSVSVSASVERPGPSLMADKQAGGDDPAHPWTDVVTGKRRNKSKAVGTKKVASADPSSVDVAPETIPPMDVTPTATATNPTEESPDASMEVNVASLKRKVDDVAEDLTPLPRNKVLSQPVLVNDGGIDIAEMLSQDSYYDESLAIHNRHVPS